MAFGTASSLSNLNGNFKEVYADDVTMLIPEQHKIQKRFKLELGSKELGNYYNQPVLLSDEAGVTYANPTDGAFPLNEAEPAVMQNARVRDSAILIRTALAYDVLHRASQKGKKAFKSATELHIKAMVSCLSKRVEVAIPYGQSLSGIGQVLKSASPAAPSGGKIVLPIKSGHWAPGIWAGSKGTRIDAFKSTDLISNYNSATKINSNAVLKVDSVSFTNKTVTLSGNGTDLTAIQTALDTAGGNSDVVLVYQGAKGKEMIGLEKIVTNTGSLFDIDAAVYDLWAGNDGTVSGDLSLTQIFVKLSQLLERGADSEMLVICPTRAWNVLMVDNVLKKQERDASYNPKKAEFGSEEVRLHFAGGSVEIMASLYVKEKDIFIVSPRHIKRLGTTDITFKSGVKEDEYFLHLPDNAGVELRAMTSQAVFTDAPCRHMLVTGFTYASGY